MIDRLRGLDDLATADRRIARAEELIVRLSKAVATLDPASHGAEVGRRSLKLMGETLVAFRAAREMLRQRLGTETTGVALDPSPAGDPTALADEHAASPPALDPEQEEVFRALLNLEIRVDSPGWFDHLWMHALQNDFRPEQDENGPLRIALRQ